MVFIISEIGTNHMGSLTIAKKIIDAAVNAGVDAVKFQKKDVENIYTDKFLDSPLESPWGKTQREMRLHREFSINDFKKIDKYCKSKKIPWFVSCWDTKSQLQMRQFRTKYNKVSSAMLIHYDLLELIAKEKKYTFISTGMSTINEIKKAIHIFRKHKCQFELMHTHSAYPMPPEEANLLCIPMLQKKFKCDVGYSGHESTATDISIPAVLLGATSLERHVTIDRTLYGYDQSASLEPVGLAKLVRDVRIIDKIMGSGKKQIWPTEIPNIEKLRQKLV